MPMTDIRPELADETATEAEVDAVLIYSFTHRQKLRGQRGFPKCVEPKSPKSPRRWRRDEIVAWLRQEWGEDFPKEIAQIEATFLRPKKDDPRD